MRLGVEVGVKEAERERLLQEGNYKVLSQTVAMMRSCESAQDMTDFLDEEDCFEEIEEDYARRK